MVDRSKVNVHALADYGTKLSGGPTGSALATFRTGTVAPIADIASPQLGMINTNEAMVFRDWYRDHIGDALRQLIIDSTTGLMALGGGATVMAANYKDGDLAQAKALDEVFDLFNRSAGKPSLDYDLTHSTKAAAKVKVSDVGRLGHKPPDPPPPPSDSPAQRARAQVKHHTDTYGKDEKWHPAQDGSTP